MQENWFSTDEANEFSENLPSLYENMLKECEGKDIDDDDGDIEIISIGAFARKKENTDKEVVYENPPFSNFPNTEPSDALRALCIYTPESSQEK